MKRLTLTAFVFSIGILLSSCNIFEPSEIDYSNKILFTSERSGKKQLYMVNPNGTGLRQITDGNYTHFNGHWSPDAQKIICNTNENFSGGENYIAIMNSDSTGRKLIARGIFRDWLPDPSEFIYYTWPSIEIQFRNMSLNVMDTSGESGYVLSTEYYATCSISPDEDKIIFSCVSDVLENFKILDFPELTNPITLDQKGGYPKYSHSGDEIAFGYDDPDTEGWGTIYIMNSDGSNVRKIIEESTDYQYVEPRWSPDDEKILFIRIGPELEDWYLYTINIDGTNMKRLISDNTVSFCDWSN